MFIIENIDVRIDRRVGGADGSYCKSFGNDVICSEEKIDG